mmetsp:Transcript_23554/g.63391  ORF Transcript_23554/g.63391 Transcript_23554/m.63391 type:complete len:210 (+) Transcript_23554:1024-1653(+)
MVFRRGTRSWRRWASRRRAAACELSQCEKRTGWAGWRWVTPAVRRSTCVSPMLAMASISPSRSSVIFHTSSRIHIRTSVATWSLRERPVWSLPPFGPMSSVRRRSFAVWISSSPGLSSNVPAAHSARTCSSPATICVFSSAVSVGEALAYAIEPFRSTSQKTLSKPIDALKRSISGSTSPENRAVHRTPRVAAMVPVPRWFEREVGSRR